MSASLRWDGLEEFKAALRRLPEELTGEAGHIVEGAANATASDVKQAYASHRLTGNLQKGVTVTHFENGKFSAGAVVKSTAKHASIFEVGTEARHYVTVNGNRHETGKMPPGNIFIRSAIKNRRRMYQRLVEMMERHGLKVTGDAG